MFQYFTLAAILSRIGLTITVVYVKLPKMGNWEQWILYVLAAVEQTSRETARTIEDINTLIDNVITQAQNKTKAIEREGFVDLLFKWPYCKINIVERELRCSRITATKYLNEITQTWIA